MVTEWGQWVSPGKNKKNDGTFHLLVRKLALLALDMVCMFVLVQGVAGTRREKEMPFNRKMFHSVLYSTEIKNNKKIVMHLKHLNGLWRHISEL